MARFCCILLQAIPELGVLAEIVKRRWFTISIQIRRLNTMALSDTQVFTALVIALLPAILAFRLSTELYK